MWNDVDLEIRESDTIGSFKRAVVNQYNVPEYFLPFDSPVDYALDRHFLRNSYQTVARCLLCSQLLSL